MNSELGFVLASFALVVAVISRTVTQEGIFEELRVWAKARKTPVGRKLAYPLTCQYCFSHWVSAGVLATTGFRLDFVESSVMNFLLSVFVLVGLANTLLISYEYVTVKVRRAREETTQIAASTRELEIRNRIGEYNLKVIKVLEETNAKQAEESITGTEFHPKIGKFGAN